ncbi:MAG: DNA (cytosine-5-)-methyltransferase [Lentisphaerae bacterium]|nr:DNA (cytosine-5-)-methyltransferase [Lentisphaerota bacterium]
MAAVVLAASTAAITNCVLDTEVQLALDFGEIPYPPPDDCRFTFIDLFAGIGGFRLAMQANGGKCVFSCEWDRYAQETYFANFGETPYGDIRKIKADTIPDHTVLCAGFPCQPFSLAGVSKKNSLGRKHGFEDETQGTLFFELARVIREKRPAAIFLENVKNLLRHGGGSTFEVIRRALADELGYVIRWVVVDGARWVPQHRERVFIVGYDPSRVTIKEDEIVIPEAPRKGVPPRRELSDIVKLEVAPEYTLGPGTWATLERHRKHHEEAGHGFGYGLHRWPISPGDVTRTISARYHKDGAEILVEQKGKLPRMLTVEEAAQLQGFEVPPFRFPVSRSQAYRQIGNSVVVPAVTSTAAEIARVLRERLK